MLSDREREALCEIERGFRDEDPALARSFEAAEQRLAPAHRGSALRCAIATAAVLGTFLLVIGLPGGALALAALGGWAWLALRHRSR